MCIGTTSNTNDGQISIRETHLSLGADKQTFFGIPRHAHLVSAFRFFSSDFIRAIVSFTTTDGFESVI